MQTSISLISLLAPLCTDPQTVDGKVPAIPHYVLNFATTNLVGGWKQAIIPAYGWGQGQGLQDSPGAGCRVAACACDHDGDNIGYGCISVKRRRQNLGIAKMA